MMQIMMMKLADIAAISAGFPFRGAIEVVPEGKVFVVQMKNVDPEMGVDWLSVTRSNAPGKREPDWLREGDVIFAARGSRNYAALIEGAPTNAVCSPHFFVLRLRDQATVLPAFLAWQINQAPARKYFEQSATGSYILNIRRQVLEDLEVAVPARQQQDQIVAFNRAAQEERAVMTRLIANRKNQMEAIAHDLRNKFGG